MPKERERLVYKASTSKEMSRADGGTITSCKHWRKCSVFFRKDGCEIAWGRRWKSMNLHNSDESDERSETMGRPGGMLGEGHLSTGLWILGRKYSWRGRGSSGGRRNLCTLEGISFSCFILLIRVRKIDADSRWRGWGMGI